MEGKLITSVIPKSARVYLFYSLSSFPMSVLGTSHDVFLLHTSPHSAFQQHIHYRTSSYKLFSWGSWGLSLVELRDLPTLKLFWRHSSLLVAVIVFYAVAIVFTVLGYILLIFEPEPRQPSGPVNFLDSLPTK